MLSELHEQDDAQAKAAATKAEAQQKMGQRDGEIYKALGYFIMAVGIPVLIGTYFAAQVNTRAATVNAVCSIALLSIGVASWVYGGIVLARHK